MKRSILLSTISALALCAAPASAAMRVVHHPHHPHHRAATRYAATGYGAVRPYASRVSPTITCRYADGTPFDPDIIGGPNHVGDGGPAANLGGFDPCEP